MSCPRESLVQEINIFQEYGRSAFDKQHRSPWWNDLQGEGGVYAQRVGQVVIAGVGGV